MVQIQDDRLSLPAGPLDRACRATSRDAQRPRPPRRPLAIHFTFDRPVDASMAPFFLAAKDGRFGAEHLNVSFNSAAGSPEALARVATGDSELALVDINELIRFRDKADAPPVKAVFVLFNRAPYAIVARKSRGIHSLPDLDGKTVGVADSDLSIRLWPALAQQNGINVAQVKFYKISAAVREPMLSAGQVDAVAGFSYLSAVNLRDRGVPADDLAVLRYADYGCEAYGFAVIANPAFAAAKPDAREGLRPRADRRHQRDRQRSGARGGRSHQPDRRRRPRPRAGAPAHACSPTTS